MEVLLKHTCKQNRSYSRTMVIYTYIKRIFEKKNLQKGKYSTLIIFLIVFVHVLFQSLYFKDTLIKEFHQIYFKINISEFKYWNVFHLDVYIYVFL